MASVEIRAGNVVIHIHGIDKLLTLRSTLTIPLTHVRRVEVRPPQARVETQQKTLRLAGGYWPGAFTTGYFAVTGEIVFYDVHDPEQTIGLEVEHESVRRIIVEVEDETPEQAAAKIEGARAAVSGSTGLD